MYRDKLYALDHNNYSDLKSIIYSKQQHDSLNLCDLQPWFATSKKISGFPRLYCITGRMRPSIFFDMLYFIYVVLLGHYGYIPFSTEARLITVSSIAYSSVHLHYLAYLIDSFYVYTCQENWLWSYICFGLILYIREHFVDMVVGITYSHRNITFLVFQSIYLQYEGFTCHCVCAASISNSDSTGRSV